MNQEILDYLKSQRVSVLAVEMLDGSPHAATVHFAHSGNPLAFFFRTSRDYRKAEALVGKASARASLVIGMAESDMKTLQLDGEVRLLRDDEKEMFNEIYLGKFPEKEAKPDDPKVLNFVFTPIWWRFTDWKTPQGKMIVTSDDV